MAPPPPLAADLQQQLQEMSQKQKVQEMSWDACNSYLPGDEISRRKAIRFPTGGILPPDNKTKEDNRCSWPLYIDTEVTYPRLFNESKLSLITIFDVSSKMVYFFRTFHFNHAQLKAIRIAMKELEQDRNLVTFGPETSLQLDKEERKELKIEKLRTLDIQQGTGMSLKKMVDRLAKKKISKTETMSDWTVPTLRHDQIQYAAMDAIALHYLNIKSDVDWSFNLPKMLNPDSTFRTPTFFNPREPNSSEIGIICDDLEYMKDVVDWMQEFDVCITLEKIRKKLEAVRTWEKEWEWDKYWKLVVEHQIHRMEDFRTSRQRDRDQLDKHLVRCMEDLRKVLEK